MRDVKSCTACAAMCCMMMFPSQCHGWNSELTESLLGGENARIREQAQMEGKTHWTEVGVGVTPDGMPYMQSVSRGTSYSLLRAGMLLVASAAIPPEGGVFHRAVVLLLKHGEGGSLGIVLNKPLKLDELLPSEHLEPAEAFEEVLGDTPANLGAHRLLNGGPVPGLEVLHSGSEHCTAKANSRRGRRPRLYDSRGQLLPEESRESSSLPPEGHELVPGVFISPSDAFVRCALAEPSGVPKLLVAPSNAGWGAGQLDGEYRRGDWLLCEATADVVFGPKPEEMWREMLYTPKGMRLCSAVAHDHEQDGA
jgi:putative transcriptional regulator